MSTPEGKIKALFVRMLDAALPRNAVYRFMPVQMGYGEATLDYLMCVGGRFVAVETKKDAKTKLTNRQVVTKARIEKAGGKVWVVYDSVTATDAVNALVHLHAASLDYVPIVGNGVDALERRDPEALKSAADLAATLSAGKKATK